MPGIASSCFCVAELISTSATFFAGAGFFAGAFASSATAVPNTSAANTNPRITCFTFHPFVDGLQQHDARPNYSGGRLTSRDRERYFFAPLPAALPAAGFAALPLPAAG